MESDIIDAIALDTSAASETSDAIKASLYSKSLEKINSLRPEVATSLLNYNDPNNEIESEPSEISPETSESEEENN